VPEPIADEPELEPTLVLPPDASAASVAISRDRFEAGTKATVVLARADALILAVAAPVAAVLDAPLLAMATDDLPQAVTDEVARLGAERVVTVGLSIPLPSAERIGSPDDDAAALSVAAAAFVRAAAGTVRAFAIADTDAAGALAGTVAAAAALRRFPVMIGADAARTGATDGERRAAVTYLVGTDAIAASRSVPGGFPLPAPTVEATADRLAQLLRADGVLQNADASAGAATGVVGVASTSTDPVLLATLAACGGPVLFAVPDPAPARIYTFT
jgi:hypothetical protein